MKFTILDIYPVKNHRLIKDTAGGYGTGNNFGKTIFSRILNLFVDNMLGMPAVYVMYVYSILKPNEIIYSRDINDTNLIDSDFVILPSSIIAHESELKALDHLNTVNKKVFVTGIFANVFKEKYKTKNSIVIPDEAENFFYKIKKNNNLNYEYLNGLFTGKYEISNNNFQDNLDDLPFPDWGTYVKKFPLRNNFLNFNSKVAIPILATRGCPYSCFKYCTYPLQQGRKVRARSVQNIVDEIKHWKNTLKTNKFVFRDPVFSINRKHTLELCRALIKENININYLVETHLNNLDDELLDLLKKSGLKMVYVGIESSNANILKDIDRFTVKNDKQFEIIKKLKDANISVKSMYMLGNPDDDEETIKATIKYSKLLPNQFVQYSVFTPYPGTPIYEKFKDRIIENKMENFDQYKLVYKHKKLSRNEIEKLKNLAYFKFYFNLKSLFNIIKLFVLSKIHYEA